MNECLLALCLALAPVDSAAVTVPVLPLRIDGGIEAPFVAGPESASSYGRAGESRGEPDPPDRLLGEDKFKHFVVSFLVTSLAASGARVAGLDRDASLWTGAGVGVGVGLLKEVRDMTDPIGDPSFLDVAWNLAGVGVGTAAAAQGW